ncbi:MAG: hypothetical protein ACI9VR_003923 [Cognaticolwellia sp.]
MSGSGPTREQRAQGVFWVGLLLSLLICMLPVLSDPTRIVLGSPAGEASTHIFGLLSGFESPGLRVSSLANFPQGLRSDLADPINLIWLWPGKIWGLRGAAVGWNLLCASTLLLAGWGGFRLGRQLHPSTPEAATVLGLALACSPYLQGVAFSSGRSEYWAWAWLALVLSWTLSALRKPSGLGIARAALGFMALALSGWQPLIFGGMVLLPALFLISGKLPKWPLVPMASLAAVAAGVLLFQHLSADPWWIRRIVSEEVVAAPAHLAELWPDTPSGQIGDRLMLPGALLLMLAAGGMARQKGWAALALTLGLLALGPAIGMGEHILPGPAALLAPLPILGGLSGWSRLALVGVLPLAVLAAEAVARLQPRLGAWVLLLAIPLLIEGAAIRPELPASHFISSSEPTLDYALVRSPPGAILELPSAPIGLSLDKETLRDRALLQTISHGRASSLVSSPEPTNAWLVSPLLFALDHRESLKAVDCSTQPQLTRAGFALLLLHRDWMGSSRADHAERILRAQHGAPVKEGPGWAMFLAAGQGPGGC